MSKGVIQSFKENGRTFIFPLHYSFYLSQIGRVASCHPETGHKSLAVDSETLPTCGVPKSHSGLFKGKWSSIRFGRVVDLPSSPRTFFLASVRILSRSSVVSRGESQDREMLER